VCNRQNIDMSRETQEDDVVREVVNRQAPHVRIIHTGNDCACGGKPFKVLERKPNLVREPFSDVAALVAIPISCLTQLSPRP
jgi:hypothetical protein